MTALLLTAAILAAGHANELKTRPAVEYGKDEDHDCLQPRVLRADPTLDDFREAQRRWLEEQFPGRPFAREGTLLFLDSPEKDGAGPVAVHGEKARVELRQGTSWPVCFEIDRVQGWPTGQPEKAISDRVGEAIFRESIAFLPNESQVVRGSPDCATCTELDRRPHYILAWAFRMTGKPFVDHRIHLWVDEKGNLLQDEIHIPNCKALPALCVFSVDEADALRIAREAGLEDGLEPWKASFHYHGDGRFVWSVSNLMTRDDDGSEEGNGVQIDPSTGTVLGRFGWFSAS